jgi:hypothetical protein
VKLAQQRHTLEQAMQEFKARVQKAHPQDADVELRNIKSWEDVASTERKARDEQVSSCNQALAYVL